MRLRGYPPFAKWVVRDTECLHAVTVSPLPELKKIPNADQVSSVRKGY